MVSVRLRTAVPGLLQQRAIVSVHECRGTMIALFLPVLSPSALDRARALIDALGPSTKVVSPHPAPPVPPAEWIQLAHPDPAAWRQWVEARRPSVVVIDGSGAHTRAATGLDATVAVVVQLDGDVDGDVGAAYSEADLILVPWPAGRVVESWPVRWEEHTLHLGALGWRARSAARRRPGDIEALTHWRQCMVLSATGAGPRPRERRAMMTGSADWSWTYAPDHAVLDDGPVWETLWRCSVVVCAPTPANLAAVAVARKPAVLVTGTWSYGQAFLADAASRTAPVLVQDSWPDPGDWRALLEQARLLDGNAWEAWSPEPGLRALAGIARGVPVTTALAAPAQV